MEEAVLDEISFHNFLFKQLCQDDLKLNIAPENMVIYSTFSITCGMNYVAATARCSTYVFHHFIKPDNSVYCHY